MPADSPQHRLRLRLPDGAEFEAEGSPEFVAGERREFLGARQQPISGTKETSEPPKEPAWETLIEVKGPVLQLRSKILGNGAERDACLILMAAARNILREQKPTASKIARWLRASGYPIGRIDRVIAATVSQGEILASGTRRARCYELSGPGLAKGWRLALRLAHHIQPISD